MKTFTVIYIERGEKKQNVINAESEAGAIDFIQQLDPNNNILGLVEMVETLPSFEVAEQIVLARMIELMDKLKERGGSPYISLSLSEYSKAANWGLYPDNICDTDSRIDADTLREAVAKIPPVQSPAEKHARAIAKLKSELAELEAKQP